MSTVWLEGADGGSKGLVRGRPRFGWMYSVKVALGSIVMMAEVLRQCAKDRKDWRALGQILKHA